MNNKCIQRLNNKQTGAVLIFAMAILLLTGIIASAVMRTGILEVKMVSNSQFKEEAFQKTDAVINAVAANQNNFVVAGDIGFKVCAAGSTEVSCNAHTIALPAEVINVPTGVDLNYHSVRMGPLISPLPVRLSADQASSASGFNIAIFEVTAEFDGREEGLGHHQVVQGVGIKVASSAQ